MTSLQLLYLASVGGAVLFFAAGVATMALRRRPALDPAIPDRVRREHVAPVETYELDMLRARAERAEAANQPLRTELERLLTEAPDRARRAEAEARLLEASSQLEHHKRLGRAFEERARQLGTELDQARAAAAAATNRASHLALELQRVTTAAEERTTQIDRLRSTASHDLSLELERAKTAATAAAEQAAHAEARARDAERQAAERAQTVRDLSARTEQLEGRVRDAEALRAEYVRLRTSVSESQFLKTEVARLEERIRAMQREAIVGPTIPRRQPRSSQQHIPTKGTIADALTAAIERFRDAATRSIAIADPLGFPLASAGDDAGSLAAYAALLLGAANRASELLPMATPTSIELVDDHGARVSMWTFEVERERMLLVDLSVAPVDPRRVDTALADLAAILAPTVEARR